MEETFAALAEAFAKIIVWGNYPGGIYPGCKCPGNIPREKLSGGGEIIGGGGAITQGAIVQGTILLRGNCPGSNHPGSNCPGGNFPRGQFSLGVIIIGGNCPSGSHPGGSFSRRQFSGYRLQGSFEFYKFYL